MNENISRAAGAEHGQGVEEEELAEVVRPLGRPLEQRTTLYGRIHTVGRRLPAPTATPVRIGRA
jgi:FO synthase